MQQQNLELYAKMHPVRLSVGELEVIYKPGTRFKKAYITTPDEAIGFFQRLYGLTENIQERFYTLFLDAAKQTLGYQLISIGGLTATVVDPARVFYAAMRVNAHSIIVAHNHPSGNMSPSKADLTLTNRLVECGKLLGIEVMDHIIVGDEKAISFRDSGYWKFN